MSFPLDSNAPRRNPRAPLPDPGFIAFAKNAKHRPPGTHPLEWREQMRANAMALVSFDGAEELASWPVTDGSKLGFGR